MSETVHANSPATDEQLAEEARKWDCGELTPAGWVSAPEAVPNPRLYYTRSADDLVLTPSLGSCVAVATPVPPHGVPTGVAVRLESSTATCQLQLATAHIGVVEIVDATGTVLYRLTPHALEVMATNRNNRHIEVRSVGNG